MYVCIELNLENMKNKTTTIVEDITEGIASVEIDGVTYNITIDNEFEYWLQEKASEMQNSLTHEELDYQTREFTPATLKDILGHEELIVEWVDSEDITSEIKSVFNCCGTEQTYSEDSNICEYCFEHFI